MAVTARLNTGETLADRILKVDHAGEHGAVNIYRGQIAICRLMRARLLPDLLETCAHEERHRAAFAREMQARGLRRCRSYHLCGIGGLVLGLVSGMLGTGAIATTTLAVEQVVLVHLQEQRAVLADVDAAAFEVVSSIVGDEQAHHDQSAAVARGSMWRHMLRPMVSASTEIVIWLGMRL